MKAEPCRCPAPNPECTRSGRPMVGRLWELCSGNCPEDRPCTQEKSDAYRELWDSKNLIEEKAPLRPIGNCMHIGGMVRTERCPSCSGTVKVKVFECEIYGECTLAKPIDGVAGCCYGRGTFCKDFRLGDKEVPKPARWTYGVVTVPERIDGCLPRTLESLKRAGFTEPRLFVDGADDPAPYRKFGLPVTMRPPPALGPFGNWILALWELYIRNATCNRFALFQDDIILSRNVLQYLNRCEYPKNGYWNLNTFPSNQQLAAGYNERTGNLGKEGWYLSNQMGRSAAALAFSREAVMLILQSHDHIVNRPTMAVKAKVSVDGAVNGAMKKVKPPWREYVHNPSLIQHTNTGSTIRANIAPGHPPSYPVAVSFRGEEFDALELLENKTKSAVPTAPPAARPRGNRIGLVGYNAPCGLGTKNRQLATYLPIDRWLVCPHRSGKMLPPHPDVDTIVCPAGDPRKVEEFVKSVDVVLFDEVPYYPNLIHLCLEHGRRIVCIPELEWLPTRGWPERVDLFLCPTKQSYELLRGSLPCVYAPWPVDVSAFEYQQREKAERFLFINGTGGWRGRKGASAIKEALKLWPEMPLVVRSQNDERWPENLPNATFFSGPTKTSADLYSYGDVLLCPHSVDGTGLEPMEAMACGVPVIATDGLPWNELPVIGRIPATVERKQVARMVDWYVPSPQGLVEQCKGWLGKSISEQSDNVWRWARARRWDAAAEQFTELVLRGVPDGVSSGVRSDRLDSSLASSGAD